MFCICVKRPLPPGDNPITVNKYSYYYKIPLIIQSLKCRIYIQNFLTTAKQTNILKFLCPAAAARCPLQSLSADSQLTAAVTHPKPKPSQSSLVSSNSHSSASLRTLCFRIGKNVTKWAAGVKQHKKIFNFLKYEIRFPTKCGVFVGKLR
jgi:hypothetical protein